MKSKTDLEGRMQDCLRKLGISLTVVWVIPEAESSKHGEISQGCLFIYDRDEREAWSTFQHEVFEYRFKEVTYAYRVLINGLIETVEKLTYERKERFLESLPQMVKVVSEETQIEPCTRNTKDPVVSRSSHRPSSIA